MGESGEPIKRYVKSSYYKEHMLVKSAADKNIISLKKLLGERVDINSLDQSGKTAMHRAAMNGHYEILKTLIANGGKVKCIDGNLVTPLHLAAYHGHIQAVRLLLLAEADENAKTTNGLKPIDYTEYDSPIWHILKGAEMGELPLAVDTINKSDTPFVPKEVVLTRPWTPEDIAKKKMLQERNKKNKKKK